MFCIICNSEISKKEAKTVKIKGLQILIKHSLLNNDGLINHFEGVKEIILHTNCWRNYTREKCSRNYSNIILPEMVLVDEVEAGDEDNASDNMMMMPELPEMGVMEEMKSGDEDNTMMMPEMDVMEEMKSGDEDNTMMMPKMEIMEEMKACDDDNEMTSNNCWFPFQEKCLFCAGDVSDAAIQKESKKNARRRNIICTVAKEKTKHSIYKAIMKNSADRNQMVQQRIENVCLVKAKARYHKRCFINILKPAQTFERKPGRPESTDVSSAMEIIYNHIDTSEDSQFTITELRDVPSNFKPSSHTILRKIIQKYGDKVAVTMIPKYGALITKKMHIGNILAAWYKQKHADDRLNTVKNAADILREDIHLKLYDKDVSPSDILLANAEIDVPDSVHLFFDTFERTPK